MIAGDQIVAEAVSLLVCCVGGAAVVQEVTQLAGKDWPAMTLLAVLTIGIGGWLVRTLDKVGDRTVTAIEGNTKAQNAVAEKLTVLTLQEAQSQHATEQKRAEMVAKLDKLFDLVQTLQLQVQNLQAHGMKP